MSLVLAAAAFAASGAAAHGPGTPPRSYENSSFVLVGKPDQVGAPIPTEQSPSANEADRTVRVEGPSWIYRPLAGAVLEVAALGGVIREAPRLAHVAFSWKF
jgi:hypothetical protein